MAGFGAPGTCVTVAHWGFWSAEQAVVLIAVIAIRAAAAAAKNFFTGLVLSLDCETIVIIP